MKLLCVSLFNSYLGCYDNPTFTNLKEDEICEQYRRSILTNPEQAYAAHVADKVVTVVGTFDDVSGSFELLEMPKKVLDLSTCFPRGYLASKQGA